ncbi:MAG: flagellar motor switch protein FliN [Candidatus Zixiibacteriota bacterium]|nr:MAG: flagellar motor switch protein FliN [candidate division Zixibacteria bacterium]
MDEKNGIEMPMNENVPDEAAGDDSAVRENESPEPVAEEEKSAPEPGQAGEELSDEPPADDVPEKPDMTVAEESAEGSPSDLLSQEDVDSVLDSAGGEQLPDEDPVAQHRPAVKQADFQQLSVTGDQEQTQNIDLLMDVDLPVSIELGRTKLCISEILALGPGSIIELDKLVGEPVDLLVNQKRVARGEVVVVEENFGLRITQLVSPEERLQKLR